MCWYWMVVKMTSKNSFFAPQPFVVVCAISSRIGVLTAVQAGRHL
jgi:hypothetical protein